MISFTTRVLTVVRQIPKGKVLTYKEVARRAGRPRAFRAVGNILNRYDDRKIKVPCHRVIRSDGKIGGFRWGNKKKTQLLREEGVIK